MPSIWAMVGLNSSAFHSGLGKIKDEARAAGQEIASSLGENLTGKLAQFASVAAIEEAGRKVFEFAEHISILAERLGISVEAAQAWDYALSLNGSSLDKASGFFEKLALARQKAFEGNEKSIDSFARLGVTLDDLRNKRIEGIAMQISEAFQSGDPQELIASLREVGGRSAGEMVAAFREGLADLVKDAKNAGVVMGEEVVSGLRRAADEAKTIWRQFMAGIAPMFEFLAKGLTLLWRVGNMEMRAMAGFFSGGVKGASDLVRQYQDELSEQERVQKAREDARKKPLPYSMDEDAAENKKDIKADERAAKAAEREQKRREDLEERIAEKKKEIDQTHLHGSGMHYEVNHLQRIGAYSASQSSSLTALAVHQRNEQHLANIQRGIDKLTEKLGPVTQF